MDFFAAKAESATPGDDVDGFAQAIADRFKHSPVFTANLNAPLPNKLSAPSNILPPETFKSISPKDIQPYLDDPSTLFIDIRSHAAYASTRLPNALSLSVPSTLLKRPLFPLERLATMLPSLSARNRFKKWRQTSKLVVYDADSSGTQSGHLPEGNNILGLLRKFASDSDSAYKGQLLWLKGGFQGVWKECRDLVDTRPVDPDADDDETSSTSLRPNNLPMSAFGSSSTTVNKSGLTASSLRPNFVRSAQPLPAMAFNPFFDTIRQNVELSQGITERIPLKVSKRVRRRLRDLPFNWLREIGRRADIKADNDSSDDDSLSESPDRLSSVFFPSSESLLTSSSSGESSCSPPDRALVDEGMEALAMQFYRIELAEQKRLMGVMQHHTKESGTQSKSGPGLSSSSMRLDGPLSSLGPQTSPDSPFPYSITAGIEKGAKNRYRHIWPFEHARVRLHKEPSPRQSRPQISPTHSTFSHTHNSNDISLNLNSNLNPSGSSLHNQTPQNFNSSSSSHSSSLFEPTPASSSTTSSPSTSMRPPPPSGPLSGPGRPFTLSLPSSYSSSLSASRPYAPPGSPKKSVLSSSASGSPVRRSTTRSPRPNARGLKLDLGLGGDGRFANGAQTFGRSAVAFGGAGRFGGVGSSGSASTNGSGMQMSSTEPRFTQMRGGHGSGGSGGESAIESSATESEREHEFEDGYQSMSASTSTGQHIGSGMEGKRYGSPEYDDYVNASYVQPLCTTRRYIATQGPLEATFTDFWTIVYQQNVHVIVMLTREIEGSMVKCGSYWKDEVYGSLRLKLIDVRGSEDDARTDMRKTDTAGQHSQQTQGHLGPSGFKHDSIKDEGSFSFFPTIKTEEEENKKREKGRRKGKQREERKERRQRAKEEDVEMDVNTAGAGASDSGSGSSSRKDKSKPKHWIPSKHKSIIKRTFLLSHTGYPHIPPRKVVQFQYLGWPDMNVPEHPTGLLSLINQVDKAVEAADISLEKHWKLM
ncbi:hypothetical protein D9758_007312 [Tetrapyrgos nigripes]|uniref:Uncharacterized protein n=1 Tax=Tetrapyrgos nigripes TaxID=182062 RepID=A0A8H5GAW9_9AGAR|nr:hypothetical protein D9758_007312 [Tetrapyrgos nigripes]